MDNGNATIDTTPNGSDIWYNYNNLLSYDCLYNFNLGNRGSGKSYGAKKKAVKDFLYKGSQFIYLRRYKTELKKVGSFFNDIKHEFPDVVLEVKGRTFYCNGEVMGYAVALSTSGIEKSTPYPLVNLIIYDEFLISTSATQRYLSNEVIAFLEFYETVDRKRDTTKVLFIGNSITSVNPYFVYFKIRPQHNKRFTVYGKKYAIESGTNEEFKRQKRATRFGQIIDGTEYGAYAIDNEFLEDSDHFIEKKTANAYFDFSIFYRGVYYGFWVDNKEGKIFMSSKYDPTSLMSFSLTSKDHKPNLMLIKGERNNFALRKLRKAYQYSYLFFENQTIKKAGEDIIKLIY